MYIFLTLFINLPPLFHFKSSSRRLSDLRSPKTTWSQPSRTFWKTVKLRSEPPPPTKSKVGPLEINPFLLTGDQLSIKINFLAEVKALFIFFKFNTIPPLLEFCENLPEDSREQIIMTHILPCVKVSKNNPCLRHYPLFISCFFFSIQLSSAKKRIIFVWPFFNTTVKGV